MSSLKRQGAVVLLLAVSLSMLAPVVAQAQCPDSRIYVGGSVTDATATKGSRANPAADLNEAYLICLTHCQNGAYLYQYNEQKEKYLYIGFCVPEAKEPSGVPLAQPVLMGLLGTVAVGAIAWGIHLRLRLRRMDEGK
jgi:hypothetical protein